MSNIKRVKGPWPGQGEYVRIIQDGKATARLGCPGCGTISPMSDHEIAADGSVTPSVGCPNDCGYHEVGVILEEWKGPPINPPCTCK